MKKLNVALLLCVLYVYAGLFNGCAPLTSLTEDTRRQYDSLYQPLTGKPNEGGVFNGEEEALTAAVHVSEMARIKNQNSQGSEELERASSKEVKSIMRIPGSLFGLVGNPHPTKKLKITVNQKGTCLKDNYDLPPRTFKEVYLPPVDYSLDFKLEDQAFDPIPYRVSSANTTSKIIEPGYYYSELEPGSMEKYEPIKKLTEMKDISINFLFLGPER